MPTNSSIPRPGPLWIRLNFLSDLINQHESQLLDYAKAPVFWQNHLHVGRVSRCLCGGMHYCRQVYVHISVTECGDQKLIMVSPSITLYLLIMREGLSLTLELISSARPTDLWSPGICLEQTPSIATWCWGSELRPPACVSKYASLPTKASLPPKKWPL